MSHPRENNMRREQRPTLPPIRDLIGEDLFQAPILSHLRSEADHGAPAANRRDYLHPRSPPMGAATQRPLPGQLYAPALLAQNISPYGYPHPEMNRSAPSTPSQYPLEVQHSRIRSLTDPSPRSGPNHRSMTPSDTLAYPSLDSQTRLQVTSNNHSAPYHERARHLQPPFTGHSHVSSYLPEHGMSAGRYPDVVTSGIDASAREPVMSGPPRYVCDFCGKAFNRPSSLKIHLNSHTGAKPFVCPYEHCGRSFSVLSNMRRHARAHNLAPPDQQEPSDAEERSQQIQSEPSTSQRKSQSPSQTTSPLPETSQPVAPQSSPPPRRLRVRKASTSKRPHRTSPPEEPSPPKRKKRRRS